LSSSNESFFSLLGNAAHVSDSAIANLPPPHSPSAKIQPFNVLRMVNGNRIFNRRLQVFSKKDIPRL
jgi:hypothetical protein